MGERAFKWGRRRPGVAALVAALVLVTVLGVTLLALGAGEQHRLAQEANDKAEKARIALGELAAESRARERAHAEALAEGRARELQFRTSLYAHSIREAADALGTDELSLARRLLDDCPEEVRGFEWDYLNLRHARLAITLGRHRWTLRGGGGHPLCFTWAVSNDGMSVELLLADCDGLADSDSTLAALRPKLRQRMLVLSGHRTPVRDLLVSPDGTCVVTCASVDAEDGSAEVFVWELPSGRKICELAAPRTLPAWPSQVDSKYVATGSKYRGRGRKGKPQVRAWEVGTGRQVFAQDNAFGPVLFGPLRVPVSSDRDAPPVPDMLRLIGLTAVAKSGRVVPAEWQLSTGKLVRTMADSDRRPQVGDVDGIVLGMTGEDRIYLSFTVPLQPGEMGVPPPPPAGIMPSLGPRNSGPTTRDGSGHGGRRRRSNDSGPRGSCPGTGGRVTYWAQITAGRGSAVRGRRDRQTWTWTQEWRFGEGDVASVALSPDGQCCWLS